MPRTHRLSWLIGVVLAVTTIALYLPVRGYDFTEVDDPVYVTENAHVRAGLSLDGIQWAFTTGHAGNWHPLTWLSHMIDVQAFGVDPGAHHLVNVGLHVLNTVLLLALLVRLTGAPWRSAFVAAIFALHPLHVESVAWVAERKDVLSGLFFMLTIWAYVGYAKHPGVGRKALVTVVFALGLMAKPMLVTLPAVLLLLDLWPLRRWTLGDPKALLRLVKEKAGLFLLAACSSIVTIFVQARGGAVASLETVTYGDRVGNVLVVMAEYLHKMVWPTHLSFLYPRQDSVPMSVVLASAAVLALLSLIAIRSSTARPAVLVGWFWYVVMLLPVSGLIQAGVQGTADRYTYLPMIGISIMIAWALPGAWGTTRIGRVLLAIAGLGVAAGMSLMASRQLPVWRNNVTLWTNATTVALGVDEYTAHLSLGATLLDKRRFEEAREHYLEASRQRAESADARYGLGLSYLRAGAAAEAIKHLEEALRLAPGSLPVRTDLAAAFVLAGRLDEAIVEYQRLVEMQPGEQRFRTALDILIARRQSRAK